MSKPIRIKLNVKLIDKAAMFRAQSGAIYLDLVAWERRDGPDKYGSTHTVKQAYKEGEGPQDVPILGSLTLPQPPEYQNEHTSQRPAKPQNKPSRQEDDQEIPF